MALINASIVISSGLSQANFDEALIDNDFNLIEKKYIRPVLGEDLYDELIADGSSGWSAANQTLVEDYIQPCLAKYVIYESLPMIRGNITSSGIVVNDPQTSNAASDNVYHNIRSKIISDAEFLKSLLKDYLDDNPDSNTDITNLYECSTSSGTNRGGLLPY